MREFVAARAEPRLAEVRPLHAAHSNVGAVRRRAERQRGFGRVEALVGGRVVAASAQARWRPAWFLDVDCGGETKQVYFRGDRGLADPGVYPLEHELAVLQLLEAEGILVPHVYGWSDDPRGIIMEQLPGRANLATAESEEERAAVLDHYMELLAEVHRIPAERLGGLGLPVPQTPEELGLADLPKWEKSYQKLRKQPDPTIAFTLAWLKRNVPDRQGQACLIACDSGQLMFDRGRVTGLVDLELACIGDPLADLAGMRCRDLSEPLGDLSRGFRRYAEIQGEALDLRAIHYHTIRFSLNTPLAVAPLVSMAPKGLNLAQYEAWRLVYGRIPLECIAELGGFELHAPEPVDAAPTRFAALTRTLHETLGSDRDPDERSYDEDTTLRLAEWNERVERFGPVVARQELDDAGALLGAVQTDWRACDEALERFIAGAGPDEDARIAQYLYRRTLREQSLLKPAMRELEFAELQRIAL